MNILVTGDLAAYTKSLCTQVDKSQQLVLAGRDIPAGKYSSPVSAFRYSVQDQLFTELFKSFDFDVVVFVLSQGEQADGNQSGSLENLSRLLSLCIRHRIRRFILLTSAAVYESLGGDEKSQPMLANHANVLPESAERMCMLYSEQSGQESLILRIPCLYGETVNDSLMVRALLQAARRETVTLPGGADQNCEFIHVEDATSLLIRMIEDAADTEMQVIHASGAKAVTYGEIAQWIQLQFPQCNIAFSAGSTGLASPGKSANARQQYDWLALHDLKHDILEMAAATAGDKRKHPARYKKHLILLKNHRWVLQLLEIMLGFALMEYLVSATGNTLQFRFIDIRLLFVVIIGSIYGARSGVLAALLACLSNILGYISLNLDWRALVYNVDNWLPYVSYLLVGVVTGYTRDKSSSAVEFEKQRMVVLEKRYIFLHDLYHQTLKNKGQYKDQIINCRDSYGKVYEITSRLDSFITDEILEEAVHVLEEVFENSSVAIYSVNSTKTFARLEACSAGLSDSLQQSVSVTQYRELYDNLQSDRVWVNRKMLARYPFYGVPLYLDNALWAVIMIYEVPYKHKTASGANQLTIIGRLMQASLARANAYRNAAEAQSAIEGTYVMMRESFIRLLDIRHEMKMRHISEFSLLRIVDACIDLAALCEKVRGVIRRTDIIGQGADGNIYILLIQAQTNAGKQVIGRLAALGIRCIPAEYPMDSRNLEEASGDVA